MLHSHPASSHGPIRVSPSICRVRVSSAAQSALLLLGLAAPVGFQAVFASPPQERVFQELRKYVNARSIVDMPTDEMVALYPELKNLAIVESQGELDPILRKVGERVEVFFRDFPNTASVERVRRERWRTTGELEVRVDEKYNYLLLARAQDGVIGLQEDRDGATGEPVKRKMVPGFSFLTSGYASAPLYFHPLCRKSTRFRYLGKETAKSETYVIAFAQLPETRWPSGIFNAEGQSAFILLQGVAWVNPDSSQIVRMRTDLLAPRLDVGLNRQTTEVSFSEVRFENPARSVWLPKEVIVTIVYQSSIFRNRHRYSDYKLFTVETQDKVGKPSVPP